MNFRFGLGSASATTPGRAGAANAGFYRAGRTAGLLIFFLPAKFFRADLVFFLADIGWIARIIGVLRVGTIIFDPELNRVEVHLYREIVHDGFHAEGGRRARWSAESARGAGIDVHT